MYKLELMTMEDIDEVAAVERRCFTNPWPLAAYRRELRSPRQNYYIVLRSTGDVLSTGQYPVVMQTQSEPARGLRRIWPFSALGGSVSAEPIIGFAGMWHLLDEAHVTTIGVAPEYQGSGLGEALFLALFQEAIERRAVWLTLEVRVSNYTAQRLYTKYGLTIQGKRHRYYTDNNEDAYIMWSESLRDEQYLSRIEALRQEHVQRLSNPQPGVER